jgi:hypothetical protein
MVVTNMVVANMVVVATSGKLWSQDRRMTTVSGKL